MSNDVLPAGRTGVRIPAEARDVSLFQKSIPVLGLTKHLLWESESLQGDAVPVPEVNYSSPYSAKVKNERSYTSKPPYAIMALTAITSPFVH
jgi:hypothetical protein